MRLREEELPRFNQLLNDRCRQVQELELTLADMQESLQKQHTEAQILAAKHENLEA